MPSRAIRGAAADVREAVRHEHRRRQRARGREQRREGEPHDALRAHAVFNDGCRRSQSRTKALPTRNTKLSHQIAASSERRDSRLAVSLGFVWRCPVLSVRPALPQTL
mmetsp:Transcript_16247/g.50263  ORF Transcript_16247/g.50263 Transcript_16247/m.50263 type:complete len:108 (-) Transcript_16247:8-331(-)